MPKIIAISNQKGGVGKTTTAINLASSLAILNQRTLLIDADPQANATSGLGVDFNIITKSFYDALIGEATMAETLLQTSCPLLHISPSHIDLVGAELELIDIPNREKLLKIALQPIKDNYDFIIIDCSPSLGLITLNALTTADSVLVPVQCEYFALEGLGKLLKTIKLVQGRYNLNLSLEGILLTMYDSRLRLAQQVSVDLREHFGNTVFETIIRRNSKIAEAPSYGQSVILFSPQSSGAISYLDLASEVLNNNNIDITNINQREVQLRIKEIIKNNNNIEQ